MYGHAYFGGGYWGPQYWGPFGSIPINPPPTPGDGATEYWGQPYWPRRYWGQGYWGSPAPPAARVVGSSVAVGRRQRLIRALLAEEEERSVLDMMRRQQMEQLQLAVNFRRLQAEAFKQQLVDQQIDQARTAITTVFFGEL